MTVGWRVSIPVLTSMILASSVMPSGQRSDPTATRGPAHGDGGVAAFYVWNEKLPGRPGRLNGATIIDELLFPPEGNWGEGANLEARLAGRGRPPRFKQTAAGAP